MKRGTLEATINNVEDNVIFLVKKCLGLIILF